MLNINFKKKNLIFHIMLDNIRKNPFFGNEEINATKRLNILLPTKTLNRDLFFFFFNIPEQLC